MNLEEASRLISESAGGAIPIFLPSVGKELLFQPLSTGHQKLLSKISVGISEYDADMVRFGLFDKMLLEKKDEVRSTLLSASDMVSFIASLKRQSSSELGYYVFGKKCPAKVDAVLDLNSVVENCKKVELTKVSVKKEFGSKKYEFILENPTWYDTAILKESMKQFDSSEGLDSLAHFALNKVCLYISQILIDDDEVTGPNGEAFCRIPVPDRIRFFDSLPPQLTVDPDDEGSLFRVINEKFDEEAEQKLIFGETSFVCPSCGETVEGVKTYDSFFAL